MAFPLVHVPAKHDLGSTDGLGYCHQPGIVKLQCANHQPDACVPACRSAPQTSDAARPWERSASPVRFLSHVSVEYRKRQRSGRCQDLSRSPPQSKDAKPCQKGKIHGLVHQFTNTVTCSAQRGEQHQVIIFSRSPSASHPPASKRAEPSWCRTRKWNTRSLEEAELKVPKH